MNKYEILILYVLIQYYWDRSTTYCNTTKGEILLFIHHCINAYIFLGGFLFNTVYHLLFIIIVLIHWITNDNKCYITEITNEYCGYETDKKFQDLLQKLNISRIYENIHWIILIGILIYDIVKIQKKYKK